MKPTGENKLTRDSNRMFRKIFELGFDMINLVNAEGKIEYASPAAFDVLGYTPAEILGMGLFDLVHPDDIPRTQTLLRDITIYPAEKFRVEMRLKHKSGIWQWMKIGVTNLLDDPDVRAIVTIGRDITDRREAEQLLHDHAEELEKRVRQRTDELQRTVNLMAGRELRIAELRETIKTLRSQLQRAGLVPVANDPLLDED